MGIAHICSRCPLHTGPTLCAYRLVARCGWTWGEVGWHRAGAAARRFGLGDRGTLTVGTLTVGAAADVVVLDPSSVADVATYERPRELAVGVEHVLVNGVRVMTGGVLTGATPGHPVTPS